MFVVEGFVAVVPERTDSLYRLWADCLSAVNYTVNECGETGSSRSVFCVSAGFQRWRTEKIKSWEGRNVLSQTKDKWRPPLQSLYNTPVTSFCLFVTCAAVRGVAHCLFVLLTVWGLLNSLSYQCLTFVLVFDPQKCILLLFCGPLYTAAGGVIRCAAQILSKKKH